VSDTGRRVLWVLAIALALFYILSQPQHAADAVTAVFAALIAAFQQIIEFLTAIGG
jgi:Na+/H+ antiporter NhaD/arsenite permease-like protein